MVAGAGEERRRAVAAVGGEAERAHVRRVRVDERRRLGDHPAARLGGRDARGEVLDHDARPHDPHRQLAAPHARRRAVARVAVEARARDGGVPDAPGVLPGRAARRDPGHELAARVERDDVDGPPRPVVGREPLDELERGAPVHVALGRRCVGIAHRRLEGRAVEVAAASVSSSARSKPCSSAKRSAPSPTRRQWTGRSSSTRRAIEIGCGKPRTAATAPTARVEPTMTAASSSTTPQAFGRPPVPT